MQPLHKSCYHLDKRCYEEFRLTEDILMEHAALGMAEYIKAHFPRDSTLLIIAGVGNNGADGIVLARLLCGYCAVKLFLPFGVKSAMAKIQLERVEKLGVEIIDTLPNLSGVMALASPKGGAKVALPKSYDIIVDALFGAGLGRELDGKTQEIIKTMNELDSFKIACDIPTGISEEGNPLPIAFCADVTITMGALKESLYSDNAKDFVGEILCADLGLPRATYDVPSDTYLLEESDLKLPSRIQKTTHKGTYGHLAVIAGEKEGAGILSALSALHFGIGLVTIVGDLKSSLPYSVMQDGRLPANTTAIALGMGFGSDWQSERVQEVIKSKEPIILDADIFHSATIEKFLEQTERAIVLTPHPKEFVALWNRLFGGEASASLVTVEGDQAMLKPHFRELDIATLQSMRLHYVREFCRYYPHITLLLKGANSIIAQDKECFVNPHGSAKLSKGGSGDVLSGLIGALLAQGYSSLDAAIQASLALTAGARRYNGSSYAMLPTDLIEEIGQLEKNSSTF